MTRKRKYKKLTKYWLKEDNIKVTIKPMWVMPKFVSVIIEEDGHKTIFKLYPYGWELMETDSVRHVNNRNRYVWILGKIRFVSWNKDYQLDSYIK